MNEKKIISQISTQISIQLMSVLNLIKLTKKNSLITLLYHLYLVNSAIFGYSVQFSSFPFKSNLNVEPTAPEQKLSQLGCNLYLQYK